MRQIRSQRRPTLHTVKLRVVLVAKAVLSSVFQTLREVDVFGEGVDTQVAVALAVGAITLDGDALLLAFGLFFVQWRRELHTVPYGAAVTV